MGRAPTEIKLSGAGTAVAEYLTLHARVRRADLDEWVSVIGMKVEFLISKVKVAEAITDKYNGAANARVLLGERFVGDVTYPLVARAIGNTHFWKSAAVNEVRFHRSAPAFTVTRPTGVVGSKAKIVVTMKQTVGLKKPIVGRALVFSLNEGRYKFRATTSASGTATATFGVPNVGPNPVEISFAGDRHYRKAGTKTYLFGTAPPKATNAQANGTRASAQAASRAKKPARTTTKTKTRTRSKPSPRTAASA